MKISKDKHITRKGVVKRNPKVKHFPMYAVEDPEGNGMSEEDYYRTWQEGIDSGIVWSLQGWYGRTAMSLIEQGLCHKPKKKSAKNSHDYYGNRMW